MEKWAEGTGQAFPGGVVVFGLRVRNDGDGSASQVVVTDLLPAGTGYLADTSGVAPTILGTEVSWGLGPLDPGQEIQFYLFLQHLGGPDDVLHNQVDAWATHDDGLSNNHAEADVHVVNKQPDLWVSKSPDPGDPAPGETMLWRIDYGNNGPVASGPVTLVDTLPVGTEFVDWWPEQDLGWTLTSTTTSSVEFQVPSVPGEWGGQLYLRLALDLDLEPGTQLINGVEVTAGHDSDPSNNLSGVDVWVSEPRWDAGVYKSFGHGVLVPGGFVQYNLHVRNHGNVAAHFTVADLFPAGTAFAGSGRWVVGQEEPFPPDTLDSTSAEWNLGVLEPGDWLDMFVRFDIASTTPPGSVLENCAQVGMDHADGWSENDRSCRVDQVNEPGVNLAVEKTYSWNGEGQLQYHIEVRNIGSVDLYDVVLCDTLPANTAFVAWWHWFWEQLDLTLKSPSYLEWTFNRLEPGWATAIELQVDLDQAVVGELGLSFVNIAAVIAPDDVAPGDNVSAVTAYTGPDLYIEKALASAHPLPGDLVTLTFTVEFGNSSQGPWPTQGTTHITDTLQAGMTFVRATDPGDPAAVWEPELVDGNTVVWAWGEQWPWQSWSFDLVAQIDAGVPGGAILINTIEVGSDDPSDVEPIYGNNLSEVAVTVDMVKRYLFLPVVVKGY